MKLSTLRRIAAVVVAAFAIALIAAPAFAQAPATPPAPNKGDTAWMLTASALVLLMTVPGLALFYGGLVRTKNMLSMLMQVFYTVCIVCIIWVLYGYSMAFSEGASFNAFVGGFSKAFLAGITPDSNAETFTDGIVIPEYVYICFQMTFAAITPALIVGSMAERMKFSAIVLFIPLWVTFVYFPIAHMVWYWSGPSALVAAAKAVAAASGEEAKKAAEAALATVQANAGLAFQWGALDFAGGTVVHINSGIAGFMGALVVGKRVGFGREAMPPHSLTMTLVGAALLWVGWFGFNAGSALEANGTAALAMINTFVATAAAALSWMLAEQMFKGKPSLLGGASGAVAGLVAVTPASGFAGPMGAIVLGIVAGFVCMFFVLGHQERLRLRRCARCLRCALHRRHHRRHWHGHPGGALPRRHRRVRLHRGQGRRLRPRRPGDHPGQDRRPHSRLVGGRIAGDLHDPESGRRPAPGYRPGAGGSRPRRSRRARLQLLSYRSEARAPSGLAAHSSTPLPRYVLLNARRASSGRFLLRAPT